MSQRTRIQYAAKKAAEQAAEREGLPAWEGRALGREAEQKADEAYRAVSTARQAASSNMNLIRKKENLLVRAAEMFKAADVVSDNEADLEDRQVASPARWMVERAVDLVRAAQEIECSPIDDRATTRDALVYQTAAQRKRK